MADIYGVNETNPIPNDYHDNVTSRIERQVDWATPGLYVTRLRLLSDYGFPLWDVSYCHGFIGDEPVDVILPFHQLPKRGFKRAIVEYAKKDKVFAQELGILANISTLI